MNKFKLIRKVKNRIKKNRLRSEYKKKSTIIGKNVSLINSKLGSYIFIGMNATINNSNIDDFSYIANNSKLNFTSIGKFCSIAPNVMIGPGMHSGAIQNLIKKSPYRSNFMVLGMTTNVLSYTSACDIYIQPSLTEGLGRSVIEAMCLGKPVIASGIGGVGELVMDGVTGFFVPAKSPQSIAEKITYFHNNRKAISLMGKEGKERIEKDFSPEKMIDSTYSVFKELSGKK